MSLIIEFLVQQKCEIWRVIHLTRNFFLGRRRRAIIYVKKNSWTKQRLTGQLGIYKKKADYTNDEIFNRTCVKKKKKIKCQIYISTYVNSLRTLLNYNDRIND